MSTPWYRRLTNGLSASRDRLGGQLNVLLRRGPNLDEEFWNDLEETLIGSDLGYLATADIVARLRRASAEQALPDADAVIKALGT
jgi:fused signal recognition particle receptor